MRRKCTPSLILKAKAELDALEAKKAADAAAKAKPSGAAAEGAPPKKKKQVNSSAAVYSSFISYKQPLFLLSWTMFVLELIRRVERAYWSFTFISHPRRFLSGGGFECIVVGRACCEGEEEVIRAKRPTRTPRAKWARGKPSYPEINLDPLLAISTILKCLRISYTSIAKYLLPTPNQTRVCYQSQIDMHPNFKYLVPRVHKVVISKVCANQSKDRASNY